MNRTTTVWLAGLVVVGVVLTGCGSSKSGSTASGSGAASGTPIKLELISTIQSSVFGFPEAADGANAAAKEVNDAGGIKGHPIQIVVCNDQFDPNIAANCARQAVTDKVAAVISGYTAFGTTILPILQQAGIPWIADNPSSDAEVKSAIVFSLDPGVEIQYAGEQAGFRSAGCTKLAILYDGGNATAQEGAQLAKESWISLGGKVVYQTAVAETQADFTPNVTALVAAGAQCATMAIPVASIQAVISAVLASSNPNLLFGVTGGTPEMISSFGGEIKNFFQASVFYPPASGKGGIDTWVNSMKAYNPKAALSQYSYFPWAGVMIFAQVAKSLTTITPASVIAGLRKQTSITLPGLPAPLDFSKPLDIKNLTDVYNTTVVVARGNPATGQMDANVLVKNTLPQFQAWQKSVK
jgi:ABC-type branched-subunit amino acid transport system substrate-binding protein